MTVGHLPQAMLVPHVSGAVPTAHCGCSPQAMRVQTEMELRMFRQNEFMYHKMREAALNNQPMQVMAEPSTEPAPALFHKKP